MSILYMNENGWIVSHLQFLNEIYTDVDCYNTKCQLEFNKDIFNINSPFFRANQISKIPQILKMVSNKKSRRKKKLYSMSARNIQSVQCVQKLLQEIIYDARNKGFFSNPIEIDYNEQARSISQQFYNNIDHTPKRFEGGNQSNAALISKIGSSDYVIPKNCVFYSYDVRDIDKKLELNNQFDLILMDPPWWNKFIRRNKTYSYNMMYNEELTKIPVSNLLNADGIIAIWCTNATTHLRDILDLMFPMWGMKLIAKWYWVKITQSGNIVCDFDYDSGKQPYELLVFGALSTNQTSAIPDKKLVISVPSAIHSHKPPITDLIKPYISPNPKCLEMFARYLLPNWTSWGLEVLKFQHLSLYKICKVSNKNDKIWYS